MTESVAKEHHTAIARVRPDLAEAPMEAVSVGWDSAVVVAGDSVFRFPRHEAARRRLLREPAVLDMARTHVPVRVPRLTLHRDPLFSEHVRIPGEMIDPATYQGFDDETRELLAADLAATYAALHRIDLDDARAAGAGPVQPWTPPADVFEVLACELDPVLLGVAGRILGVAGALPPDETVFGHFDTHGWNMAFDAKSGRLAGLFDFGDSGIGPLHRDLSYTAFVSPDLTARVVRRYRTLSRRRVVLERVFTLHTMLRFDEIAGAPAHERPRFVWMLTDFLAALSRIRGDSLAQANDGHHVPSAGHG